MKIIEIKLSTIQDVQKIVTIVAKYPVDIDLVQGRYRVSGTSLLGILALDLTKAVKMVVEPNDKSVIISILKELGDLVVDGGEFTE